MAAVLNASDIYPAVRRFLLESGLTKTLKAFEKATSAVDDAEAVGPSKKARKAIRKMDLTAVCQVVVEASTVTPTLVAPDIYPAVRRFLLESGLAKTLKAFEKETSAGDNVEAVGRSKKVEKAIRKIELTAACQAVLESSTGASAQTNGAIEERPKKRKHAAEEASAGAVAAAEADEPPKKQKRKAEVEAEPVAEVPQEMTKKEKNKQQQQEKQNVPFSRVDYSKWMATIKDDRLIDNTHMAKQKFGGSVGDSWGDAAAVDMLKVKGKGFRKEMAKKKRASWRGGGEIDQGCNSIRLAFSSDEE